MSSRVGATLGLGKPPAMRTKWRPAAARPLARALATEPSLLLLDEPLCNLDAALQLEKRFELKDLHGRTVTTTLYVTHDKEEALVLADRIALLNRGVFGQAGTYLSPAPDPSG
ncbi:MAG: spermidine/putrescine import ATP-binding protein PotA [Hyphomicrobiales bacterium]|nr:spermidine/putrescine import ATP-binding protein PotA [Hyphomicrobiales bacterium]